MVTVGHDIFGNFPDLNKTAKISCQRTRFRSQSENIMLANWNFPQSAKISCLWKCPVLQQLEVKSIRVENKCYLAVYYDIDGVHLFVHFCSKIKIYVVQDWITQYLFILAGPQGNLGILDVSTREYTTLMRSHTGRVLCFAVDPMRRHLATVSEDCSIRVWDADSLQQVREGGKRGERVREGDWWLNVVSCTGHVFYFPFDLISFFHQNKIEKSVSKY